MIFLIRILISIVGWILLISLDYRMEAEKKGVQEAHVADLPYSDFSLKLPGFSLSVLPYLGGTDYLR